jgi:hypothetical protein
VSVDYDRSFCEEFVNRVLEAPPTIVVLIWVRLAFGTALTAASDDLWRLVEQWPSLSKWNQQAILYLLAPHIDRIARARAEAVCREAREEEPL